MPTPYTPILSEMQEILFTMTASLFGPSDNNTGLDDVRTFSETYVNVPCYRVRKPSVVTAEDYGRSEQDIFGTMDIWLFPENLPQEIGDGWYIKDTTPGSSSIGQFWIVRGNQEQNPQQGERDDGQTRLQTATALPNTLPPGVA